MTEVENPLEEYTEDEIKEMFLDMFFWVALCKRLNVFLELLKNKLPRIRF